jgi:hypothetical protein
VRRTCEPVSEPPGRSQRGVCPAVEHSSGLIQAVLCKTCISEEAVGRERNTVHLRASGQPVVHAPSYSRRHPPRDATRCIGHV